MNSTKIVGIDIGSISVSAAELTAEKEILKTATQTHEGNIVETLTAILEEFDLKNSCGIAVTSSTSDIIEGAMPVDLRISFIAAAKHLHSEMGALLIVGGEKFGLVQFDDEGNYMNYRSNTSCAAGTGSFLDQQAARLNISGIEEFSRIAHRNSGDIPKIASRCAVFAKTDLIHAQQEGYTLEEISDGLCYGLAKNIADTLFSTTDITGSMVFAGGVSKNMAVVKHISSMVDADVITDEYSSCYGAIGAALHYIENADTFDAMNIENPGDIIKDIKKEKKYHYEPLTLHLSRYPDFSSIDKYEFTSKINSQATPVEVDIYEDIFPGMEINVYLGIDIGSTSTKAVLMDEKKRVLAGFYTRTSGRPVEAVQVILETIDDISSKHGVTFAYLGAGTTGSGRKFIAEIIGADLALDEISAHARAAYELDSEVDTIIEIGGQDSKFTTMRKGMVTFSIMNNVCAAGTGSFIEEQAKKLGCPLSEYSGRAENIMAPLSSDRCTVFMERDLNYYLSEGYSVDEILASVLHSVRENYLTKVAIEKNIGKKVFFQGATAKNRALVAAFEQRLGRPIIVSEYCHLTGAIGVALNLLDDGLMETAFRGIDLYKTRIPVHTEVCELCTNHCKIRVADVGDEKAAFGFLCGRDYETKKFIRMEKNSTLLKKRSAVLNGKKSSTYRHSAVVGIPAALHLVDELPLWEKFFDLLSIKTITSEKYQSGIKDGKYITGAEFCAPIAALHGHVKHLSDKADFVFLPEYIQDKNWKRDIKRNYCYYTQYSTALIPQNLGIENRDNILTPVIRSIYSSFHLKVQLFNTVKKITGGKCSFMEVSNAYDRAQEFFGAYNDSLKKMLLSETKEMDDVGIVFVGRPYTVLSPSMNNNIPDIFAKNGVDTYFQDMLTYSDNDVQAIEELLKAVHWKYAASILESTLVIAEREGLYPVLVTSFKCTPDAYVIDYFKQIMDKHNKPYLILQLDEHDSSVGYETRIEAGIRSFRNHFRSLRLVETPESLVHDGVYRDKNLLMEKTLLVPNWDSITCKFIEGILRKEGIDSRLVDESTDTIQQSMKYNTGQCIPLNVMAQNSINYIEKNNLDPAKTVVWTPDSKIACNIGMFPYYKKNIFEAYGKGMEDLTVYVGDIIFWDIGIMTAVNVYFAYHFGGMLRKISCSIRPYEVEKGATDRAMDEAIAGIYNAFLTDGSKDDALENAVSLLQAVDVVREDRPKVAIFGDLYVRDNDVMNQGLVRLIEANGGEVITTPYSEFMRIIAAPYIKKWFKQGLYSDAAIAKVMQKTVPIMEKKYNKIFQRILPDNNKQYDNNTEEILDKFNLRLHHTGESMENILKIFHLVEQHPDLSLFVQTNPSYCCPSLVTEAMVDRIEEVTGIPVVTIEYDGTGGTKNEDVIPYLKYPRKGEMKKQKKAI